MHYAAQAWFNFSSLPVLSRDLCSGEMHVSSFFCGCVEELVAALSEDLSLLLKIKVGTSLFLGGLFLSCISQV